jgi:FkbM family methyltransferase
MTISGELTKLWNMATDADYRAQRRLIKAFRAEHGRSTPAHYTHLKPGDVVLDVGGYHGDWAEDMAARYGVVVHVFEPHPRFVQMLETRFQGRKDIKVHGFAMGAKDGVLHLSDDENASSALVTDGRVVEGVIRNVSDAFDDLNLTDIAAVKMNIEGGEYDLIPALVDQGLMGRINTLTVQFHRYSDDQVKARDTIRTALAATHDCAWVYPFIWEEWHRKPAT